MRNRLTVFLLIVREMQQAKINTLLCLIVVAIAAGLFVAMTDFSLASVDATRVMMKNMGFNLLITPQGADPARYQALDFQDADMPEDYIKKLADNGSILAQHYVGKLQKTTQIDGCTAVLTGVLAESTGGSKMKPMPTAYVVAEGKVFLGSAVARAINKKAGDSISVLGKSFAVEKVLDEMGAIPEDIRVYAHLHDVQQLIGRPARINAIDALACQCPTNAKDIIGLVEQSVQRVLPDVNVQPYHSILLARHQQRVMMDQLELVALAIVMLGSAAAICGLTYQNVTNRRHEIGVLRALGVPGWRICLLFIGKILIYGVGGAVLGCAAGRAFSLEWSIAAKPVVAPMTTLINVVIVTPLAAIVFGLPAVLSRLFQETIDVLGEGNA